MIFVLGVIAETGLISVPAFWRIRRWYVGIVVCLIGLWTGLFVAGEGNLFAACIGIISLYRLFNMLRIGKDRIENEHLFRTVRRTTFVLIVTQLILYISFLYGLGLSGIGTSVLLMSAQLIASLLILGITARNLSKTRHHSSKHFYSDKELPTVSVAVPARNETDELGTCLESILASSYPKLEVLVLDDCSQDKTPEIIREFAHDGVRFLEGHAPKKHWLAKNQAYAQLAEAASGEYILFCGVDIRLGPDAIRSLVTTMLNKKRGMMSVMPMRVGGGIRTSLIQPMRYWWELALPRRLFNRPPVLGSCWLVNTKALKKLGGFHAVSKTIVPEAYFAREMIKDDSYAFIRSDEQLDVRTVKSVEAQLSTAIRTRYPQLRKRPENVMIISILEVLFLLLPFVTMLMGLFNGFDTASYLALLSSLLLIMTHCLIMNVSNPSNSFISLFNFPFVVLTELVLTHISMYRYEFSTVEWKGRNICIPVMQVITKSKFNPGA